MNIGDGKVCVTTTGTGSKKFNFRVGKTAVGILERQAGIDYEPQQLAKKLEPLAQAIAKKLQ